MVSVVIGRFQVPRLTPAHEALLKYAAVRNTSVLVLVGSSGPVLGTQRNPLDFMMRSGVISEWILKEKFHASFRWAVLPLEDFPGRNAEWAAAVDRQIQLTYPHQDVEIIYGEHGCGEVYRDSGGKWPIKKFDSPDFAWNPRGTDIRQNINPTNYDRSAFAAGAIYSTMKRRLFAFPAVDIAVFRPNGDILLGQKAYEHDTWRLPGGMVDTTDLTLEAAAARELKEETGLNLEVGGHYDFRYGGSFRINDERFIDTPEKIMTSLFVAQAKWGDAKAGDDLARVGWAHYNHALTIIHPRHKPLVQTAITVWKEMTK